MAGGDERHRTLDIDVGFGWLGHSGRFDMLLYQNSRKYLQFSFCNNLILIKTTFYKIRFY